MVITKPAPRPGATTTRDLTIEEKAALWDEAAALHAEVRTALDEIDRLRFKVASLNSQRDALFARGRTGGNPKGQREVCSLCSMEQCVCERLG